MRATPKALIARIKGVTTREAAEALTGTKLYISRARLPEREADEWYHADLIGLAVIDRQGEPIGTVVAVLNFGAGDLIEIRPAAGGESLVVPFTDATVPRDRPCRRAPHPRPARDAGIAAPRLSSSFPRRRESSKHQSSLLTAGISGYWIARSSRAMTIVVGP